MESKKLKVLELKKSADYGHYRAELLYHPAAQNAKPQDEFRKSNCLCAEPDHFIMQLNNEMILKHKAAKPYQLRL